MSRQHREQLAEGAVEICPVQLVDHEPAAGLDRLDEHAGTEYQAFERRLQATDRLEGRPFGGRGRRQVAGAEDGGLRDFGGEEGERGLAGARRTGHHHVLAGIDRGDDLFDDVHR